MSDNLKYIPVGLVRENSVALREVNRETEAYAELVESVRKQGILNPIVVRPMVDVETGEDYYALVDGLHRLTASKDAGLETVPAHIKVIEDGDVLLAQIIGNIHRIETRPIEYSKQLQKIIAQTPTLTAASLAAQLGKSTTWISERLGLLKVKTEIQPLINDGKINLSNGFALAKLPVEEQDSFTDRAMTMSPPEFAATVQDRRTALEKARKEGRKADTAEFTAPIHMRKLKDVKAEFEVPAVAAALLRDTGVTDAAEAFALAVKWVLHQDPTSVAVAKQKDAEAKQKIADKQALATAERQKKKAENAGIQAERLKLQVALMERGASPDESKAELKAFDDAHGLVDGKFPGKKKEEEAVATA